MTLIPPLKVTYPLLMPPKEKKSMFVFPCIIKLFCPIYRLII